MALAWVGDKTIKYIFYTHNISVLGILPIFFKKVSDM